MKFLKENWFKLIIGTSILIFSCGFLFYASNLSNNSNSPDELDVFDVNIASTKYPIEIESDEIYEIWENSNEIIERFSERSDEMKKRHDEMKKRHDEIIELLLYISDHLESMRYFR